jgi:tetratricopeptide (TPR) repeat protein
MPVTFVRTPLVLFALVASVVVTAAQAPPATDAEHPFIVRQQVDRVRYETDGTRVRHVSRDVLIQSPAGLDVWRDLTVHYTVDRERVTLVRLDIVKPSGERVQPPNLALEDRRQSGLFDQKVFGDLMESHVTVPLLAVGDLLSYEIRIETTEPQAGGAFWEAHQFYTAAPIDEEILEVEVPTSVPVSVWTRPGQAGPETDAVNGRYRSLRWRRTGYRPAASPEQRSVEALLLEDADTPGADVHVSSLERWSDVGAWYRDVLAKVAPPGADVAAKARALTASASTPEDKLRALYRFVAADIHYVSLAFGLGRHEPRPADLVLQTGYGDCKDKHTLLAALAREIGVTIDPVLIGSQAALVEDAPSPAQFDHLISVWRREADPERWLWLDSTSGTTGPGVLLPNLRDKRALLVDSSGSFSLVSTPRGRQTSRMEISMIGSLAADGAQEMTVRRLAHGDHGLMFRLLQPALQGPDQVKELAGQLLADDGIGSSKVATASLDVPATDWDAPVELSYMARVKYNLASTVKKRAMWIPSPQMWLPDPDKLPVPWRLPMEEASHARVTTTYTLPDGWSAEAPVDVELVQPFGRYRSRYLVDGRQLTIERELEMPAGVLTEDDRAAYTRFRKAVIDDRAQQFGLTIPAAPAATDASAGVDLEERVRQAWDTGRVAQARDLLLELTAAEPDHPRAWNNLGRAHLMLGDANAALGPLERQVAIDPVHPLAWNNLGNAYRGLGRLADAEAAYRKHIDIAPLDKWGHLNLGLTLLALERRPDAIASLERAAAAAREDPLTRLRVGHALLQAGEQARALALFEDVVTVYPQAGYLNDAAYWLAEAGIELPRARAWADRALAMAHGSLGGATLTQVRDTNLAPLNVVINLWDTRGWIAFKEGDVATARLWLEAAYDWSDSGEVAMHVAQLREKEGRHADAVRAYARVAIGTRMAPTSRVPAAEAVARLEKAGHAAPVNVATADRESRQSSLTVPGLAAASTGEVFVAIGTDGAVEEALLGSPDGPAALVHALKGMAVPGADIARLRQVRLFRKVAFDCTTGGACTLVWQRVP